MNTVSSQSSLAEALLRLSGQTQSASLPTLPGSTDSDASTDTSSAEDSDILALSAGSASSIESSTAEIEGQNLTSILADSSAALGATKTATAYLSSQSDAAAATQGAPSAASVLSLLSGD